MVTVAFFFCDEKDFLYVLLLLLISSLGCEEGDGTGEKGEGVAEDGEGNRADEGLLRIPEAAIERLLSRALAIFAGSIIRGSGIGIADDFIF